MKELCDRTGLPRQAIHFYIQQGLLPAGRKTGRNTAVYDESHVERLKLIKKLQHERFLPLKAIKALLEAQDQAFTPSQLVALTGVKQRLRLLSPTEHQQGVPVDALIDRFGIERSEIERIVELGVLGARVEDGQMLIAEDDVWILHAWAELKRQGLADELRLKVDDVLLIQEVVQELFTREVALLAGRLDHVDPDRAAELIEKGLPIVHSLLLGFHTKKLKNFFATV
jgi:DNA-binding transcriptional MerR regulator